LYRFNSDEIYIIATMGWSSSDDYFPIVSQIFIPEKIILIDYGSRVHSPQDVLSVLRHVVYKDQPGEFIFDKEGTEKLRPWKRLIGY